MNLILRKIKWLCTIAVFISLTACSGSADSAGNSSPTNNTPSTNSTNSADNSSVRVSLQVYKSPTCGCCEKWIEHVGAAGFDTVTHHPSDLASIKTTHGIAPRYRSCHTAISVDGYVFEGHVPAHIIHRFLAQPPQNAIGLAVPGMPAGSPGMEMNNHFAAHDVLLLTTDGSSEVYEHMATADSGLPAKSTKLAD